jgi:hypothetical protein
MAVPLHFVGRAMSFDSILLYARMLQGTPDRLAMTQSRLAAESLDGRVGDAYDEEAFQHFLAVERVRAQRSERSLLLLLVSLRRSEDGSSEISRALSPTLLAALGMCIREIDFFGWYRDRRVAGAVLTQGLDLLDPAARDRILARATSILNEHLPPSVSKRLRVRVVRLGLNGNA